MLKVTRLVCHQRTKKFVCFSVFRWLCTQVPAPVHKEVPKHTISNHNIWPPLNIWRLFALFTSSRLSGLEELLVKPQGDLNPFRMGTWKQGPNIENVLWGLFVLLFYYFRNSFIICLLVFIGFEDTNIEQIAAVSHKMEFGRPTQESYDSIYLAAFRSISKQKSLNFKRVSEAWKSHLTLLQGFMLCLGLGLSALPDTEPNEWDWNTSHFANLLQVNNQSVSQRNQSKLKSTTKSTPPPLLGAWSLDQFFGRTLGQLQHHLRPGCRKLDVWFQSKLEMKLGMGWMECLLNIYEYLHIPSEDKTADCELLHKKPSLKDVFTLGRVMKQLGCGYHFELWFEVTTPWLKMYCFYSTSEAVCHRPIQQWQ